MRGKLDENLSDIGKLCIAKKYNKKGDCRGARMVRLIICRDLSEKVAEQE